MRRYETFPREDYGQVPLAFKVKSAIRHARFAWYGVVASLPLFIYMSFSLDHPHEAGVMAVFWVTLLIWAALAGWRMNITNGVRVPLPAFDGQMVYDAGSRDAFIPPAVYEAKLMTWVDYWEASPFTTKSRDVLIDALRHHTARIEAAPPDVSRQSLHLGPDFTKETAPDNAIATTDRRLRLIRCWKEQSQNWYGTWEYEWGHILAACEWTWTSEREIRSKREATNLMSSEQ